MSRFMSNNSSDHYVLFCHDTLSHTRVKIKVKVIKFNINNKFKDPYT